MNTTTRKEYNIPSHFTNASEAFNYLYEYINLFGKDFADTRALFNVGFYIENPLDNEISNPDRLWNKDYASSEWEWYLSGDPSIHKLGEIYGKVPSIWTRMADKYGMVNSNYGYQWGRSDQLNNAIRALQSNSYTRQAAISIFDGKENHRYETDTPCTYAVQFTIIDNTLDMSVVMRSNDLWYGFCNDQYCFSELQRYVAKRVGVPVGEYYHYAHNLHLYNDKLIK
tara:strand:+ start:7820 stop:8497 length:678 start_codon:yes stop_codon:yes gene_type:complete